MFARKVTRLIGGISIKHVENELRAISMLCNNSHPNIIDVFESGRLNPDENIYFIDMELCGITLQSYFDGVNVPQPFVNWRTIREEGRLSEEICHINEQLICGLAFIHNQKQVHRDLCPQNSTIGSIKSKLILVSSPLFQEPAVEDHRFWDYARGHFESTPTF